MRCCCLFIHAFIFYLSVCRCVCVAFHMPAIVLWLRFFVSIKCWAKHVYMILSIKEPTLIECVLTHYARHTSAVSYRKATPHYQEVNWMLHMNGLFFIMYDLLRDRMFNAYSNKCSRRRIICLQITLSASKRTSRLINCSRHHNCTNTHETENPSDFIRCLWTNVESTIVLLKLPIAHRLYTT